jgi:hypothetical protein
VICNRKGASEEEVEEQPVQDKAGHRGATDEKLLEGSKSHLKREGGPSEGDNGEASVEERQRRHDKGKAKVQDSWCVGLFEKVEGSRSPGAGRKRKRRRSRRSEKLKNSTGGTG